MNVLRPSRAWFVMALLLPVLAVLAMAAPAAAQSEYYTIAPCELYDSRDLFGLENKLTAGPLPLTIPVAGETCTVSNGVTQTIPAEAESVVVNVTVASPSTAGRVAVAPAGSPLLGSAGFLTDQNRALTFPVKLGTGGDVDIRVGPVGVQYHLVVFIQGYYVPRPVLDLDTNNSGGVSPNFTASFVENAPAVNITDEDVRIIDTDDTQLDHVTITLTNRPNGAAEVLTANVGATGIVASYNSTTGVLLLQGPAPLADFEGILETVKYDNTATTPDLSPRVITFVGNDGVDDGQPVTTTVTLNDLPTISAIADQTIDEDTSTAPLAFTVGDAGTPVASLTVTATSSDQSIIPNANLVLGGTNPNRTITVTPAANAFGGPVTITVSVSDGISTTTETFTVTVNPVNDAPTVTAIADQSIAEDASTGPLAFTIGDVETAAGSLAVTATSSDQTLIPDANVVLGGSGASRTVTVTPAPDQTGGPVTITVSVSDGTTTTTETFTVTVGEANDTPTITAIADQVIDEDTSTGPLAFTVGDVDTAVASLTVTATSSDQTLIPNANVVLGGVNPNRTVTVTPAANQSGGPVTITVSVSDGTNTTTETFTVTVTALDDAPTITAIADQVIDEDTSTGPLAFTIGDAETAVASLTVTATSSDQTLIPDANVVLGGVNPNRTVTVTPAANQTGGPVTITVSVSDGTNTTTETFTVMVNAVNDPPTISDVGNQAIDEDTSTGPLAVTIGDIDTPLASLTLTGTSSDQTLIPNANIVIGGSGANRTVTVTPAPNANGGPVTITLTVSDGTGSAVDTFTITINAVNDAPTVTAIADQVIDEDTSTGALPFTIGDAETPVASLTVTATSSDTTLIPNANVVIGGAGASRTVTVTPAANQSGGPVTITVSVSDGVNTATETFTVTVNNINDLPTITSIGDVTIDEDTSTGPLAFTIDDIETAPGSLTVTGTSSNTTIIPNAGIVIGGAGAGRTVTVTPAANQFGGPVTITINVSDGTATTTETFNVTVNAVNDAPTVTAIGNQTIDEDTSTGPLAFTVGDIETAAGSLTVTGTSSDTTLIPNASVVIGGSGASRTVTVTPAPNQFGGPATITITVNDGSGQPNSIVTTTFTVTVNSVNDLPTLVASPRETFHTIGNTAFEFKAAKALNPSVWISGNLVSNFTDIDGPVALSASLVSATAGASVTINPDGTFTYIPPAGATGTDTFTYAVTDSLASVNRVVTINLVSRVWYVKNNATAGGLGRSNDPFDTLAEAQTASAANDYIFVYFGNGNSTGHTTGIALKNGQRLIGEHLGLSISVAAGFNGNASPSNIALVEGVANNRPVVLNSAPGTFSISATDAVPAEVAGFRLEGTMHGFKLLTNAAFAGTGATLSFHDNIVAASTAQGVLLDLKGTGALNLELYQNSLTSAGTGLDIQETGTGSLTITKFNDNVVTGGGGGGINIANVTFDAIPSGTIQRVQGGNTEIGALGVPVGGHGIVLTNVAGSLAFGDAANLGYVRVYSGGNALQATSTLVGVIPQFQLTVRAAESGGNSALVATGGAALDLDSVTADLSLASLSSTNGLRGVSLVNVRPGSPAATFPANFRVPTGSSIITSNAGAIAFRVDQSNATITYPGTINATAGTGVSLTSNTGSTISFSGVLTLSTGSSPAFVATGGGTVTATDTASTLTTTTATALNVANTTIGAGGLKFRSISSNGGGSSGIVLNNTGSFGGLTVSGNGGSCTSAASCTGGAIQGKTVDGISLNNTRGVSLTRMFIDNNDGSGIFGDDVTDFSLAESRVSNNTDATGGAEAGLRFNELLGNCAITNTTIRDNYYDNVRITPASGVLSNLAISGVTIGPNDAAVGNNGITLLPSGSADVTVNVTSSTFQSNRASAFLANATTTTGKLTVSVTGSNFNDNNIGVDLLHAQSGDFTFNVSGNTFIGNDSNTINFSAASTSTNAGQVVGTIANNTIGNGTPDSGSRDAYGIGIDAIGDVDMVLAITNNNVRNTDFEGIFVESAFDDTDADAERARLDLTLTGNTVGRPDDNSAFPFGIMYGVRVEARHTSTLCLDMSGNTAASVGGVEHFRVRQRNTAAFIVERLTDGDATPNEVITNLATVESFIAGQNAAGSTADATNQTAGVTGFTEAANGFCRQP